MTLAIGFGKSLAASANWMPAEMQGYGRAGDGPILINSSKDWQKDLRAKSMLRLKALAGAGLRPLDFRREMAENLAFAVHPPL